MIGRLRIVGVATVILAMVGGASVVQAQFPLTPNEEANGPYTPPTCVPGVPFSDITCTTGFDPWIEQFGLDGITAGCGGGLYCPGTPVTRDQMAVFIEKAMRGTANWPPRLSQVYAVLNTDGSVNEIASGNALRTAVASIPTIGPAAPTASNHWLVRVGPGTFDFENHSLALPAYVDLEGSGIFTTTITSTTVVNAFATIDCAGTSKITDLSVTNTGGIVVARAIWCGSGTLILNRVKAFAMGGPDGNEAISLNGGVADMQESEAWAIGGDAIYLLSTPSSAYVEIRNSYLVGTYAIWNSTTATVRMATTRIVGTLHPNVGGGHYRCFANYNNDMNAAVTCPSP